MPVDDDTPTRAELERALRRAHLEVTELRDQLTELAAQVVALTRAGDEPAILAATATYADALRAADEEAPGLRLEIGNGFVDKYELPGLDIPCLELLPLCQARCCTLRFCLSTQDLDEGVARWDYGRPYVNLARDDGYCHHNGSDFGCTIYEQRPAPCRRFDCRHDDRIWADYERRIPASDEARARALAEPMAPTSEARERAAERRAALTAEALSLRSDD